MRRQLVHRGHAVVGADGAAELREPANHSFRDRGRSAPGDRPSAGVGGGQHQQSDRSGAGLIEREQAVSGRARQQGTRFSFPEEHAGQSQR